MLTQEQQDLYSKIVKNPETFVIVAWSREDLRDMLREEGIEPSEKNVDFLLKAREFPVEDIQDKDDGSRLEHALRRVRRSNRRHQGSHQMP